MSEKKTEFERVEVTFGGVALPGFSGPLKYVREPCAPSHPDLYCVLRAIEIRNPPFPIRMEITPDILGAALVFFATVRHRDTGEPVEIVHATRIPLRASARELVLFAHQELQRLFAHEASECFVYHERRVFDPHRQFEKPEI